MDDEIEQLLTSRQIGASKRQDVTLEPPGERLKIVCSPMRLFFDLTKTGEFCRKKAILTPPARVGESGLECFAF